MGKVSNEQAHFKCTVHRVVLSQCLERQLLSWSYSVQYVQHDKFCSEWSEEINSAVSWSGDFHTENTCKINGICVVQKRGLHQTMPLLCML